jgi:hypothetical protein
VACLRALDPAVLEQLREAGVLQSSILGGLDRSESERQAQGGNP